MKNAIHDKKAILPLLTFIFFLGAVLFAPVPLHADDEVGEIEQVFYGTPRNNQRSPLSQETRERILRAALWEPAELTVEMEPSYNQYLNDATPRTGYTIEGYQIMEFNVSNPPSFPTAARPEEIPFVVNTSPVSIPVTVAVGGSAQGAPFENGMSVGGCSLGIASNAYLSIINFVFVLTPILLLGGLRKVLISQEELAAWLEGLA